MARRTDPRNEDNDEPRLACRWQQSHEARPMKRRAFLFTRSFLILAAFTSYGDFIFSSSESVIQDKAINDSTPADLFTVKVDFGINFLDWRI